jgi:hypothetical protein
MNQLRTAIEAAHRLAETQPLPRRVVDEVEEEARAVLRSWTGLLPAEMREAARR